MAGISSPNPPPIPPGLDPKIGAVLNRWLLPLWQRLLTTIQTITSTPSTGFTSSATVDGQGNATVTVGTNITGIMKGDGTGAVAAVAGVDYVTPGSILTMPLPDSQGGTAYTVTSTDQSVLLTPTAAFTLTLPSAAANPKRTLIVLSYAAFTVSSATANVTPLASATPGTAILAAGAGKWCFMQSDGTNWRILMGN